MFSRDANDPAAVLLAGADPARVWRILERVVRDGMILLASDGRLEYANAPARRMLSREDDENDENDEEIARVARELWRRMADAEDGAAQRVEVMVSERPRVLYVEASGIEEDEGTGHILILKDARAVQALQEDLYLANRVRGLGELYTSMAHDLKTPVNAMTLTLDALRDSLLEDAGEAADRIDRIEHVDTVRDELTRFHRSIQAFLAQTAPPSDARRRFDLRRLVREVVRLSQTLAESREVRVRVDTSGAVMVLGFRDRLRQALLNVVVNAVEATPAGGEVRIGVATEDESTILSVCDDGPGIESARASHLFKMHFTTKPRGSGIGLFVARAAVVAHGGRIDARNRAGGGAVFEIRLPCDSSTPVIE
ncbi:MAG: HAMP domain-containing sensor histidine kinase [bacterium]